MKVQCSWCGQVFDTRLFTACPVCNSPEEDFDHTAGVQPVPILDFDDYGRPHNPATGDRERKAEHDAEEAGESYLFLGGPSSGIQVKVTRLDRKGSDHDAPTG